MFLEDVITVCIIRNTDISVKCIYAYFFLFFFCKMLNNSGERGLIKECETFFIRNFIFIFPGVFSFDVTVAAAERQ